MHWTRALPVNSLFLLVWFGLVFNLWPVGRNNPRPKSSRRWRGDYAQALCTAVQDKCWAGAGGPERGLALAARGPAPRVAPHRSHPGMLPLLWYPGEPCWVSCPPGRTHSSVLYFLVLDPHCLGVSPHLPHDASFPGDVWCLMAKDCFVS